MGIRAGLTEGKNTSLSPATVTERLRLLGNRVADVLAPADLEQLKSFVAKAAQDHASSSQSRSSNTLTRKGKRAGEWRFYRTNLQPVSVSSAAPEDAGGRHRDQRSGSSQGINAEDPLEQLQSPAFPFSVGEERYFVYLPLAKTIIETDLPGCRELVGYAPTDLRQDTPPRVDRARDRARESGPDAAYMPTDVTLFPTVDCNLRCVYCYSSAGDNPHHMPVSLGKAAINQIVANALVLDVKRISVTFHGGGEPTMNWPLVREVTLYARRLAAALDIKVHISVGTNGCMSDDKRDWILDNLDSLTLSLDGTAEVHNRQRPMRSGTGSFDRAFKTLRSCEERQFPYNIRTTVTRESAPHLVEFVELLAEQAPRAQGLQLEPVCLTGRALATDQRPLQPEEFQEAFLTAKRHGAKLGYRVTNAVCNISAIRDAYCGAYGRNFVVTPSGEVTTCYEVGDSQDPRWDTFHIGRYDPGTRHWIFDAASIRRLQRIRAKTLRSCQSCYARYHCAGGCPAKNRLGERSRGREDRCKATRALIRDALIDLTRTASEKTWRTTGRRDFNLRAAQGQETLLASCRLYEMPPGPEPCNCHWVCPAEGGVCVPEICPKFGCTDEGCTDEGCTDEGCTDEGCTDEGCTDEGCTDKGCTDEGCTDKGCTDLGCTDKPRPGIQN